MSRSGRAVRLAGGAVLVCLAGCAGAQLEAGADATAQPEEARRPLASDPYTATAGAPAGDGAARRSVAFLDPPRVPRVEAASSPGADLRVALVRVAGGSLDDAGPLLLDLEAQLAYERRFASVLALPWPAGVDAVDVAGLVAAARDDEQDWLLIDFAEALRGPGREAYVFECADGRCVARWRAGQPPPESLDVDPLLRLAQAYAAVTR